MNWKLLAPSNANVTKTRFHLRHALPAIQHVSSFCTPVITALKNPVIFCFSAGDPRRESFYKLESLLKTNKRPRILRSLPGGVVPSLVGSAAWCADVYLLYIGKRVPVQYLSAVSWRYIFEPWQAFTEYTSNKQYNWNVLYNSKNSVAVEVWYASFPRFPGLRVKNLHAG